MPQSTPARARLGPAPAVAVAMTLAVTAAVIGTLVLAWVLAADDATSSRADGPAGPDHTIVTRGDAAFPATVLSPVVMTLPAVPGVITDDAQTISEQLDEAMGELLVDFSGASPSSAPATCLVFGIQPHTDQYAVAATITNTDGEVSTYRVDYELLGPDGASLGTDFSVVSAVAPGTTVRDDTMGFLSDPVPWDQVTCRVTAVRRIPG